MNSTVLTLTICAAAALAGPVAAQSARVLEATSDAPRMIIRYGDLDLSKTEGATVLIQRIKNAAGVACGPEPELTGLADSGRFHACRHSNMDVAVKAVNAPHVTALFNPTWTSNLVAIR